MVLFDGLEQALVGYSDVWHPDGSKVQRAIYDGEKVLQCVMDDGMTEDEAIEWIEFNVEGAYVGEDTPIIYWPVDLTELYNA